MPIRPYTAADHDSVVALWSKVFDYSHAHNSAEGAIRRKEDFGDGLFYVAAHRSKVVGTVMLGWDGHRGWIYSLAVDPDFQKRGIGTDLIHHGEKILKEKGCPKINLQVLAKNSSVVAFYKSLGYVVEERVSIGKRLTE